MTTITTRAGKGTPLTNNELDANFINLNAEVTPSRPTIRPSLSLDFANSKSVDSRITFTRASSATRYDANGVLQKVVNDQPRIDFDPSTGECKGLLVEEQRTNTCFDFFIWTVQGAAGFEPNSVIGPDGKMSGCKVNAVGDNWRISTTGSFSSGSTYITVSVWIKQGNRPTCRFEINTRDGSTNRANDTFYTFATGVITTTSQYATASVVAKSGDWVRIATTIQVPSTYSGFDLYAYGGDYWGVPGYTYWALPQFEVGAFATSNIQAITNFTSRASSATYFDSTGTLRYAGVNQPRYGYGYDTASGTWKSQGLVLEAASTNLFPRTESSLFINDPYAGLTYGYASPDGGLNAFQITSATGYTPMSVTAGNVYTYSVYVKNVSATSVGFYADGGFGIAGSGTHTFSTSTFAVTNNAAQVIASGFQSLSNGWTRIWATWQCTTTANFCARLATIGGSAYFYGLQFEQGYVPTSYIPTYGASATRAADVSSSAQTTRASDKAVVIGNTLTNALNPIEGCLVWSRSRSAVGALPELTLFADGGSGTDFYYKSLAWMNTAQSCNVTSLNNSVSQFSQTVTIPTDLSVVTTAFAYAENNMAASINGSSPTTDTVASVQQSVNTLGLAIPGSNNSNQHIRKVAYYPKRLTNAQLQALTA